MTWAVQSTKKNCCVIQTNNELEMTSSIFSPRLLHKRSDNESTPSIM